MLQVYKGRGMKLSAMNSAKIELLFQANATLGEGPVWDARSGDLYWVDIRRRRIARYNYTKKCQTGVWITQKRPGCIALTTDPQKLLVAAREDVFVLDLQSGATSQIVRLPIDTARFRANDGRLDAKGRFWIGTMIDDVHAPESFSGGELFCVDTDGNIDRADYEFELPNGIGWNKDNTLMYMNDTTTLLTYCFDFDLAAGRLSNRRVFYDHSGGAGFPDGLSVDSDGCIWSAQWDGWNIRKISPDAELLEEFQMPVRRPSSAAFFGPKMNYIAITSATVDFTTEDFLSSPNGGSLFSMGTDAKGCEEYQFPLSGHFLSNLS